MVPTKAQEILDNLPPEQRDNYRINNNGDLVVYNRAYRRQFPPTNPNYTKSTWARQSKKELKRKRKLGRK